MRIVVDMRKDANAQVILNQLYQYTQLQDTVGVIMLAIDHKVPKVLTLKQMLQKYVEFQDEVVRRRTQYDLKKAKERAHILEGLKKATDIVDELIATIRACKGGMAEAKAAIMEQFGFDDPQADAIVKLQLGRLAGLEILKIEEELGAPAGKDPRIGRTFWPTTPGCWRSSKNELLEMKKRFGDERRTEIQSVTGEVDIEDLIAEEQCVYTLTEAGYIKRQLKATYQAQKRGGRGISGMTRKEEDIVQEMFVGSTHDYVLFVTDKGRLFRFKGYTIAEGSRTSKGSNIVNLLQLAEGEKVTNMIRQSKDAESEGGFVTMVTKQGLIKRTPLEQYANIRKSGLIGIALNEGDALAWTRLTSGHDMLIVATRNGQAIRFNEEDARPMGRSGHGVRAIKLAEGDEVVGVCICREGGTVLTVTENGKGRRTETDTYRITARGGKGIRNYDAAKDKVAAVKIVDDIDDVLLSSQEGIIIRLHANEIPIQSRYGSGVRVMRLGENDKVMVLARTDHDDDAQTETRSRPRRATSPPPSSWPPWKPPMKRRRREGSPKQTMPKTKIILRRLPLFAKGSPFGGAGADAPEEGAKVLAWNFPLENIDRIKTKQARNQKMLWFRAFVSGLIGSTSGGDQYGVEFRLFPQQRPCWAWALPWTHSRSRWPTACTTPT